MEANNLVFLDEMGVLLGLTRSTGRSLKGQRTYARQPFYRGQRVTVVGAMSCQRVLTLQTLDHALNGDDFREFVKTHLVPQLWPGAVVVMDNLAAHKVEGITELIASVGAKTVYLSPYSPEFNPIEHLWSQLKTFLRKFSPTRIQLVIKLIDIALLLNHPERCRNWFAHCCYCIS